MRSTLVACLAVAACDAMNVDLGEPLFPEDASADGDGSACGDEDEDGFGEGCLRGDDCDDGDAARNPAAPEVCDGIDNNCNDETDEPPLADTDGTCGSTVGECRLGVPCCRGGVLDCCGGMGPRTEACNCLDDDCDGQTDEDASCPGGIPCDACACGTGCDPEDESACPPGLLCAGECPGTAPPFPCIPRPCDGVVCDSGSRCETCTGACINACEDVDCGDLRCCGGACCETWEACVSAEDQGLTCVDRSCTREDLPCAEGQVCYRHECMDDPCAEVRCASDELCRLGECLRACPDCPADRKCVDGECAEDPCANVVCVIEHTACCNGRCVHDPCAADVSCEPGEWCDPCAASCREDLCPVTRCPGSYVCRTNECVPRRRVITQVRTLGCVCALAHAQTPPSWIVLAAVLLSAWNGCRDFNPAAGPGNDNVQPPLTAALRKRTKPPIESPAWLGTERRAQ